MSEFHGQFVWHELMTTDMKAAEKFYRAAIGWGAKDAGMPNMSYTLFSAGEIPVAGLMGAPPGAKSADVPPAWFGYIAVDDVDAYAARVKEKGGTIHRPPADIPGVGRFAFVTDPQGAMFALFKGTSAAPPAAPPANAPGHAGWHELHAGNWEPMWDFYSGLFGWTKGQSFDMGPMGVYQLFSCGGVAIGGMMTKQPAIPHPFWLYYFNVDAIDAAAARVTGGGGQILNGPMEVPGGSWILQCRDPQGAMFALVGAKK